MEPLCNFRDLQCLKVDENNWNRYWQTNKFSFSKTFAIVQFFAHMRVKLEKEKSANTTPNFSFSKTSNGYQKRRIFMLISNLLEGFNKMLLKKISIILCVVIPILNFLSKKPKSFGSYKHFLQSSNSYAQKTKHFSTFCQYLSI
jgi:hypothetical protein